MVMKPLATLLLPPTALDSPIEQSSNYSNRAIKDTAYSHIFVPQFIALDLP